MKPVLLVINGMGMKISKKKKKVFIESFYYQVSEGTKKFIGFHLN